MNTDLSQPGRPLTIMQVASCFTSWGGMELHLLNLSDQLRAHGHRVIVAAQPGGWVLPRAQAMGLETFEATVRRQQDWTDFGRYKAFLLQEKIDILHSHTNWDAVVPATAARLAGVPVAVMTWHLPFPFKNRRGGDLLLSLLYKRMIAISGSVRERHIQHGVAPHKIQVIHHGTNTEGFRAVTKTVPEARAELGLPLDAVAVGIVGRVSHEKGHSDLLEALRLLQTAFPHLYVVVVGDGPDVSNLQGEAAEKGIAEKVLFAGFRDDVNNVINALDMVAVPSTWHEPCSAVVQQAMALSKPVIGSRMGGTPEMIAENETGLLVPAADPPALAEAIAQLASDPLLRAQMGEAGAVRVEELFTLSHMTDQVEALYYKELAQANPMRLRAATAS
ncbi:MAG: glycosyltransferase family 4 protein [Armatimonadota bacterium]|nr:glycosyltransferase family 4 protein [Armatimonadota bacterium]